MLDILIDPWPWYVAGPLLAAIMLALIYFGEGFGVSHNLRTICTLGGAGRISDFFKIDTSKQYWNLAFIGGSMIGGYLAVRYLTSGQQIDLGANTISALESLGIMDGGSGYLPQALFGVDRLTSISGILILLGGGFLVGFGTRYAGGCTSGHAISGLSNLQLPSLIAVVGFFFGGLLMVHLFLPILF